MGIILFLRNNILPPPTRLYFFGLLLSGQSVSPHCHASFRQPHAQANVLQEELAKFVFNVVISAQTREQSTDFNYQWAQTVLSLVEYHYFNRSTI